MATKIDKTIKQQEKEESSKLWSTMSLVSGLLAATLAKKVLDTSWRAATGKTPPANPADPDVDVWEAVTWAAVSGTAIGVARMYAGRRAASYYHRSTGHLPPELESDEVKQARAAAAVAQQEAEDAAKTAEATGAKKGRRGRKKAKG
jgi:hypothetical protein